MTKWVTKWRNYKAGVGSRTDVAAESWATNCRRRRGWGERSAPVRPDLQTGSFGRRLRLTEQ